MERMATEDKEDHEDIKVQLEKEVVKESTDLGDIEDAEELEETLDVSDEKVGAEEEDSEEEDFARKTNV